MLINLKFKHTYFVLKSVDADFKEEIFRRSIVVYVIWGAALGAN